MKAHLYLICSADRLETAFFCGSSRECAAVLQMRNLGLFYSAISKQSKIWNFFRIERVELDET